MSSRDDPIIRPSSRVLLVNSAAQTLHFTVERPDMDTGRRFWFLPGGGLEPGETHEDAARRELFEETGLEVAIGPCIWLRSHTWYLPARDEWYCSVERHFLARTDATEIAKDHWAKLKEQISEARWWSLAEIQRSLDIFTPRRLAEFLPPILAGNLPAQPIEVGV